MSKGEDNRTENVSIGRKIYRKEPKTTKQRACKFLFELLYLVRYYLDLIIDTLFGFYYDSRRRFINKCKNPIVLESATSLVRKIKTRELKSEQVIQAFIDRIKEVNPVINAIVDERFEDALNEARKIDEDIANGTILEVDFQDKPLLGLPFTSKESTACKGLSFSFGLKKRQGRKSSFDADCVELIKNAGGILLGVSNIPQLNLWQETYNPVYGLTKNPYNTTRTVGGSSGGESSILAACGSPLGIGTDIGGSCRIPAFMCGVFGHKTSSNLISTKGLTFRTGKEEQTIVAFGPMTKYAEDLVPFLKVLAGKNANKLNLDHPVSINKLKIYYVTDPNDPLVSPIRNEIKAVMTRAVEYFNGVCIDKPQELTFKNLKYTLKLWKYWMDQESGSNFKNDVNNREGEVNIYAEIIKHFTIGGDYTTPTILNFINGLFPKTDAKWAIQATEDLQKELLEKLDDNSILLYPSAPFGASYHHSALLRPYNFNLFSIWNAVKFPVTQVPMGLGKEGLPLGIQVVGAPLQDRLCIAVAKELERQFGGYVPPFIVNDK